MGISCQILKSRWRIHEFKIVPHKIKNLWTTHHLNRNFNPENCWSNGDLFLRCDRQRARWIVNSIWNLNQAGLVLLDCFPSLFIYMNRAHLIWLDESCNHDKCFPNIYNEVTPTYSLTNHNHKFQMFWNIVKNTKPTCKTNWKKCKKIQKHLLTCLSLIPQQQHSKSHQRGRLFELTKS